MGVLTTKIYFVRHGETDNNVRHRFMGRTDMPLNDRGLDQARYVGQAMANTYIDCIYTSPYLRASKTAEAIKGDRDIEVIPDKGLCEIDCGLWEGMNREEIEAKWPGMIDLWQHHPEQLEIPQGETFEQVQTRAYQSIAKVLEHEKGKSIVIATHMLTIQLIIARLMGEEIANVWNLPRLDNTSITELDVHPDGQIDVIRWGDVGHLPIALQNPFVKIAGFVQDLKA